MARINKEEKHAMNYPGGKGKFFQKLINLMPHHDVYIETHLGGGAIMRNKRPANRNVGIEIDPEVVRMWNNASQGIAVVQGDAIVYLKDYVFSGNELVYCDPPYLRETRKGRRVYKFEYSKEQHLELLDVINSLPCMVMISGYYSEIYMESLKGWHTHNFQAATRQGIATEYVWMNYTPPIELHDYSYLGDTFRERERIMKKSKRWVSKLKSMHVLERQALLHAINSLNAHSS